MVRYFNEKSKSAELRPTARSGRTSTRTRRRDCFSVHDPRGDDVYVLSTTKSRRGADKACAVRRGRAHPSPRGAALPDARRARISHRGTQRSSRHAHHHGGRRDRRSSAIERGRDGATARRPREIRARRRRRRAAASIARPPGATPSRVPRRRARVRVRVRDADLSAKSPSSSLDTEFDVPNADDASDPDAPGKYDSSSLPASFCIIEGGQNQVRDFADMIPSELMNNIESRKQRVFIMLEEVRRLRVQLQLRTRDAEEPPPPPREYESVVPGFPRITENNYNDYYIYWSAVVIGFLIFGGLIAPLAEVKLGMGGTSYLEFIEFVGLPRQLAEIDPIVASFTGGAVGAIRRVLYTGPHTTAFAW